MGRARRTVVQEASSIAQSSKRLLVVGGVVDRECLELDLLDTAAHIDDRGRARCELRPDGLRTRHPGCRGTFYVCAETRRLLFAGRKQSAPLTAG
jgi:hypothetical protein